MKTETEMAEIEVPTSRAPLWATLAATFFGLGRLRPGPGTWASAAAALIWFGLARWIPPGSQWAVLAGVAAIAIVVGILAATRMAKAYEVKDAQFVVIDEVAG